MHSKFHGKQSYPSTSKGYLRFISLADFAVLFIFHVWKYMVSISFYSFSDRYNLAYSFL